MKAWGRKGGNLEILELRWSVHWWLTIFLFHDYLELSRHFLAWARPVVAPVATLLRPQPPDEATVVEDAATPEDLLAESFEYLLRGEPKAETLKQLNSN
ncbi:hypothetical protein B9Z55_028169 [Caenorhabditis nigoni]|uniref:Uncharacterized protein n=1 Tax=Caenorhabditis nigoni TaxID=1611254 RepID=A0A2G5SD23_9PELO|nr:hypothetical protein B9Z55_028169 [Caenorhabditis nigoni]